MAGYALPDGRTLIAERNETEDGWHLLIEGEPNMELIGSPLNSSLAELLGYRVAHEEWPSWIDELAAKIEAALGGHS